MSNENIDNTTVETTTAAEASGAENTPVESTPAPVVDQNTTSEAKAEKVPHKRVLQGKVKSNKNDKTIVVGVERQIAHPIYKKYYKRTKSFTAHDENNECNIGDVVRIKESRPLSATKRWVLVDIVSRAK